MSEPERPISAPATTLSRIEPWLRTLWLEPPHSRIVGLIWLGILLSICGAIAYIGAVPSYRFGHDIFVMLDGAWRTLNGQRTHVDFYSPWGPIPYLITALGLKLSHNDIRGFGYGEAIFGLLIGLCAWRVASRRLGALPALLVLTSILLIAVAPYPLGLQPNTLSDAMSYNRQGFALAGIVLIEAFNCRRTSDDRETLIGAAIGGACCAVLLFMKASYFLVAAGFIGLSLVTGIRSMRRLLGLAIGFVAITVAVMAYLHFDFAAVLSDLRTTATARRNSLSFWAIRWAFLGGLREFFPVAFLCGFVMLRERVLSRAMLTRYEPALVTLAVFAAGAMLLMTNAQLGDYPLMAFLAIVLADRAMRAATANESALLIAMLALVPVVPLLLDNVGGVGYGIVQAYKVKSNTTSARFSPSHLRSYVMFDVTDAPESDRRNNGSAYVQYLNSGVDLAGRFSPARETVFALDTQSIMAYALLRPPSRGGSICLSYNKTYSDASKPSPAWLLGGWDVIMVPKHPSGSDYDTGGVLRNYYGSIKSMFRLCAESDWWELYKRPSNLQGCQVTAK